jgi:predicted nucleic acid-binding protein
MVSKKVFIAADGFVAFIDRAHRNHVHTSAFFRYFAQEHFQLYTTVVSINDSYNTIYNTISPSLARDYLRAMALSTINVLYPESSDVKTAIKTLEQSTSVDLTFSKALTAVVCSKKSIPQVCTFEYMPSLFGIQVFYLPV